MLLISLIVSLLLHGSPMPGEAARVGNGVLGDWERPSKAVLRFHPCGSEVCATIVRLSPASTRKLDTKNPDASLRGRKLCGLDIGTGFHQADADHLVDGHLYDPVTGKTYAGSAVSNGDEVRLRGYVGISWFGKTEIWHRASAVSAAECQ